MNKKPVQTVMSETEEETVAPSNFNSELQDLIFQFKNIKDELGLRHFKNNLQIIKTKNKNNKENFKKLLEFEFTRKLIKDNSAEASYLNQMEYETAPIKCLYHRRIGSAGFRTDLGKEYPCKRYFDDSRSMDMYTIFVDIEVSPDEQITKELYWKMKNGFMPQESDFLAPRKIYQRYTLNEKEFFKFFKLL